MYKYIINNVYITSRFFMSSLHVCFAHEIVKTNLPSVYPWKNQLCDMSNYPVVLG